MANPNKPFVITLKDSAGNLGSGRVVLINQTTGERKLITAQNSAINEDLRNFSSGFSNGDKITANYNGKYYGYGSGTVDTSKAGLTITLAKGTKSTSLANVSV